MLSSDDSSHEWYGTEPGLSPPPPVYGSRPERVRVRDRRMIVLASLARRPRRWCPTFRLCGTCVGAPPFRLWGTCLLGCERVPGGSADGPSGTRP
eukprot:6789229-Prymnesium_polylepis.1